MAENDEDEGLFSRVLLPGAASILLVSYFQGWLNPWLQDLGWYTTEEQQERISKSWDEFFDRRNAAEELVPNNLGVDDMTDVIFEDQVESYYLGKMVKVNDRLYELSGKGDSNLNGYSDYYIVLWDDRWGSDGMPVKGNCLVEKGQDESRLRNTEYGEAITVYGDIKSVGKLLGFSFQRCWIEP